MNYSQFKVMTWMLAMCLMLTVAIVPGWAEGQASAAKPAAPASPSASQAATASSGTATPPKATAGAPTSQEIAAAKASGKVWVNTESGVYHKGGRWYGKTKNGKFMTEAEAKASGYKEAHR